MKTRRAKILLFLLAFAIGGGVSVWYYRFKTYHFAEVRAGELYRAGNRSMVEFATACRNAKPKTVVMLNDDEELKQSPFKEEIEFLKGNNIELVRIPVKLGGWPSADDVKKFIATASDKSKQPVLVHCAQGVRRTGMVVAAYQQTVLGLDDAKASEAIVPFGRKPTSRTLGDIRDFIESYDEKTGMLKKAPSATNPSAE